MPPGRYRHETSTYSERSRPRGSAISVYVTAKPSLEALCRSIITKAVSA